MKNKLNKTAFAFFSIILLLLLAAPAKAQEGATHIVLRKDSLLSILYKFTFEDFYLEPNLPQRFLERQTKWYGVPENETILAFIDESGGGKGKAKTGIAIGLHGLYLNNNDMSTSPGTRAIPYYKFKDHNLSRMDKKELKIEFVAIYIGGLDKKGQAQVEEILRQIKTRLLK